MVDPPAAPDRQAASRSEQPEEPRWPSLTLSGAQLAEYELLAGGALTPLRTYMSAAQAQAVLADGTLPDGTPFGRPVVLEAPADLAAGWEGTTIGLRDQEGVLLAGLTVEEVDAHGDIARLHGPLDVRRQVVHYDHVDLRLDARAIAATGRASVAVPVGRPLSAEESAALGRLVAQAPSTVLLLQTLIGAAAPDDHDVQTLIRAHRLHARRLRQAGQVVHAIVPLPAPTDDAGWRMAATVAASSGADRLVDLVGTAPRSLTHPTVISALTGPATSAEPGWDPEVAQLLERRATPPGRQGFTLFFTGLSGSGKSTVARAVMAQLHARTDRRVTLLDGDLVRQHLSSELGFSREHRDLNVTRIGFVAAEVTRHGGVAVCAPIAPYDATRQEVRRLVSAGGQFVLVHVATPLEICEARDRKGLYAKARAGEIGAFTGISDPYEEPADADVTLDTSTMSVAEAAERIMQHLDGRGLVQLDPQTP